MANINKKFFQKMIGQICWDVSYKRINLSFNLGKPRLIFDHCPNDLEEDRKLRKYTYVTGQWFLWVYHAYWKLTVIDDVSGKKKLVASTSTTDQKKRKTCSLLCGQKLTQVNINHETGETKLFFDLGAELIIRRPNRETKELYFLNDPDGYCLSINGDGTYDCGPISGIDTRREVKNVSIPNDIIVGMKCNG